jgi:hypothetical protein
LIIRSKGIKAENLEQIYKTLSKVIKEDSCFYTKDEVKDLNKRGFIKIGGFKNG